MSQIIASNVLVNGLRTEFSDTYTSIRNRQASGLLGQVMDLSVGATNRQHDFAYFEAAPHMEYWRRGDSVPSDSMGSVKFTAYVYEWARRIKWSKFDRKDDQTQSLMEAARMAGASAALLPERFFFDLLTDTANTLPAIPLAPDGAGFFAATVNGAARFGATGGNTFTTAGVTTTALILADYYKALTRFMAFQDGKGQPMFAPEVINQGVMVIHSSADLRVFEQAFNQRFVLESSAALSNITQDAGRKITTWASPRVATGKWFVVLTGVKKPTFLLNREGVQEFSSLEGDNNSDMTRSTAQEYSQWEVRQGAHIALPYAAISIT